MLVVHFSLLFGCPRAMAVCCHVATGLHFLFCVLLAICLLYILSLLFLRRIVEAMHCDEGCWIVAATSTAGISCSEPQPHSATCLMCKVFSLPATVDWLQALKCWIVS